MDPVIFYNHYYKNDDGVLLFIKSQLAWKDCKAQLPFNLSSITYLGSEQVTATVTDTSV